MNNDFIEGMEILINCKRYIENRIDFLQRQMERMDKCGKDSRPLQSEINRMQGVLGYKIPPLSFDDED